MKSKGKHTKLYEHLEKANALSGTDENIRAAIREYRRQYQTEWRRNKRQQNQEITVTLNPKELHVIESCARKHKRSRASFLKVAALAYCAKAFIVPDIFILNSILERLVMTGAEIHAYFETGALRYDVGKELLRKIDLLETEIQKCLHKPENLEDCIAAELRRNPAYREIILQLLTDTVQ